MRIITVVAAFSCLWLSSCSSTSPEAGAGRIALFNGKNLDGWTYVLADPAVARDQVWTVRDGIVVCRGEPLGALLTQQSFRNFRLVVEYRWAPGAKPGNSGIFSRVNGAPRALPRCAEVQLQHGNAGDVLTLQGMKLDATQPRYFHVARHEVAGDIDGVKKTANAEAEAGQWNRVEIQAQGGNYSVWVNGAKVNEVTGVEAPSGPIGLQSEGGEIHFRRVEVTPLL